MLLDHCFSKKFEPGVNFGDDVVKEIFGEYGNITSAVILSEGDGKSKCFGFVNFGNASCLMDQITVTGDANDYFWYMTTTQIEKNDPIFNKEVTLRVNSSGHVLHAFLNRKFVGYQYGPAYGKVNFVLEAPIHITQETNHLTLLRATLVSDGKVVKGLSKSKWTYKVGLDGDEQQLHSNVSKHKWQFANLTINKMMNWYRTTFKAPIGLDLDVVNLQTLGKGEAWVNGRSIERFWSNFSTALERCGECDYHGGYNPGKCAIDCDQPTQKWYNVSRSFSNLDGNIVTLFEEFGGSPTGVNFQTVTVGIACGSVPEGGLLELSCSGGRSISNIEFVSFSNVTSSLKNCY
ncbi:beta-galactosidase 7-like [Aristolochia californica]|uniref:beta-galactosidase 7-like n=1 Tax=Aristolochia californica TaxID=171875 RepID=UPI0035DF22B1